jgi:predicted DNA-binding protein with PD1-like motif
MQFRLQQTAQRYVIRLARGELVMESLTRFCREHAIQSGIFTAIGAVEHVSLGYYNLTTREYAFQTYESPVEVASMTGNIALVEGEPFVHAHVVLTDTENRAFGGHLEEATVAVTLEVSLVADAGSTERRLDETVGLKLLDL